jgi:type 1 glutamine amidotransferase
MFAASFVMAAAEKPAAPKAAEKTKAPVVATSEEIAKVTEAMPTAPIVKPAKPRKLLVFNLTKGFPHSSVSIGGKAFEIMGQKTGAWETVITVDPSYFAPDKLKDFDAVVMNNTTGRDLITEPAQKQALLDFVKSGKGIIGVHSALDAFYEKWPEYGEMMGGFFAGHPFRKITVKLDDPKSPLTAMFDGKGFEISDEIYTFKDPYSREKLHILMSIDWENQTADKQKSNRADNDFALAWIRDYGKGRVFYCAFGHDHAIFWNTAILKHYLAGIQYALGDLKADATPSAKLKIEAARGPVQAAQAEKPKEPAKAPAPKVNKAPLVLHAPAAAPAPEPSGLKPDAEGWITLFDGKNLGAWQKPAADKWKVVDGVLTWEKGCGSLWTKDKFGDFIVDLEFKCAKGTNSGVFLRSVEGEKNWLQGSFEIQIAAPPGDGKANKHSTGALYDCLAPSVFADKPAGEWNHMVITFKGNSLKIVLNDKPIIDANLDDWKDAGMNPDGSKNKFKTAYKDMGKVGYLGLQDHGAPVWYRNVKVKPLAAAQGGG